MFCSQNTVKPPDGEKPWIMAEYSVFVQASVV